MGKSIEINDLTFGLNLGKIRFEGDPDPALIQDLDYLRIPIGVCFNTGVSPDLTYGYIFTNYGEVGRQGWYFGSRITSNSGQCGFLMNKNDNKIRTCLAAKSVDVNIPVGMGSGIISVNLGPATVVIKSDNTLIYSDSLNGGVRSSYPIVLGGINLAGSISPNQYGDINIQDFQILDGFVVVCHLKAILYDGRPCLYDAVHGRIASGWNVTQDTTVEYMLNGTVATGTLLLG